MKSEDELDALIAEKVMGWTQKEMWGINDYREDGSPVLMPDFPNYSDDITSAWEVVEKLRELGFSVSVNAYPSTREWFMPPYENAPVSEWTYKTMESTYQCNISKYDSNWGTWLSVADKCGRSAAHAICLSALKVIE